MVVDKEFKEVFRFSQVEYPLFNEGYEAALKFMNKYIGRGEEHIIVSVTYCDDRGVIGSCNVYIVNSYIEVGNLIASFDYEKNVAVTVYSVKGNEYVRIKDKIFDSVCYTSLACCTVSTYDVRFVIRKYWDYNTKVYI